MGQLRARAPLPRIHYQFPPPVRRSDRFDSLKLITKQNTTNPHAAAVSQTSAQSAASVCPCEQTPSIAAGLCPLTAAARRFPQTATTYLGTLPALFRDTHASSSAPRSNGGALLRLPVA